MCLFRPFLELQGTSLISADVQHAKTWRCDAIPWSENNTDAFAWLHNQGKRILIVFDEASAIHSKISEVSEGALTDEDTEIIWLLAGNPTRCEGAFFEAFHRYAHLWHGEHIDSRTVEGTNIRQLQEQITTYGEDSDFVRSRILGQFPRFSQSSFIALPLIEAAALRPLPEGDAGAALVIGCDVARYGDDSSVICFRRGRDARSIPMIRLRGADTQQLAARVADEFQRHRADAVFVDEGGVGGGVVDRLRAIGVPVAGVMFGAKPLRIGYADARETYANRRSEMWGILRAWLPDGAIPDDRPLRDDLAGPSYTFVFREGRDAIFLERKSDMKARGLASPDAADALALTFAAPVVPGMHTAAQSKWSRDFATWKAEPDKSPLAALDYPLCEMIAE